MGQSFASGQGTVNVPTRRIGAVVALAAMLVVSFGGSALAAPPVNDDRGDATVVPGVPFSDSIDTREATSQDGDPNCVPTNKTVWYSFTPASGGTFVAQTVFSNYDTTMALGTPSNGNLDLIACDDDSSSDATSRIVWQAVAGQTYLIMIGAFGNGPGGDLEFGIGRAPKNPRLGSLWVAPRGGVKKLGGAVIRGNVRCAGSPGGVFIEVRVRQDVGRRIIRGRGFTVVNCNQNWSVTARVGDFKFARGKARVTARAIACNSVDVCQTKTSRKVVKLR